MSALAGFIRWNSAIFHIVYRVLFITPHATHECSFGSVRFVRADFVAASRDLADYVITERWRDVEQALAAETHILPIWLAWGSTRHEVSTHTDTQTHTHT